MMTFKKKWWRHSIIGVMLVGLAINLIGEAIIIKGNSPEEFDLGHMALWFWIGLFGIVSLNAGFSFIADAVKQRIYMEMETGEAPGKKPESKQ
ncbi:hypothetical protein [Rhodohalobacter sp.]|uniref:hypothetical protein n=1 Tax=Rhodohalobacter sp. TaxID=1974210 RepID=UPI00356397D8